MMNIFEVDFLSKLKALLTEAFTFKKYKAMHPVLAVGTGILMLPVVIASFFITAIFAVIAFFFSVFSTPTKFLHSLLQTEGKETKHATQFILYFLSWPTIFGSYVLLSFLLILILPLYALLALLLYVWSLGGFKFPKLVSTVDDLSIEVNGRYFLLPIVFICIGALILLVLPIVHGLIYFLDLYFNYREHMFLSLFLSEIYPFYIKISFVFSTLYSLIGFAPRAKKSESEASKTE